MSQGDHVVLKCQSPDCGMRYPSPRDDPRRHACPLCEGSIELVGSYNAPPPHRSDTRRSSSTVVAVLDNIRSALNVGTMLRSADGAALDHVYLGGLTAPVDNPKVIKTALGAEASVPVTSELDTFRCVDRLADEGYEIWALDATERSESLSSIASLPDRLAFVVGNEIAGIDPAILGLADRHIHLSMHGQKSTLNVGVAFGIVAHWTTSRVASS